MIPDKNDPATVRPEMAEVQGAHSGRVSPEEEVSSTNPGTDADTRRSPNGAMTPADRKSFWWCDHCSEEVDGSRVTFQEHHDTCGHPVRVIEQAEADRIAQLEAALRKHGQAVVKQCGITTLAACGGSGDAFYPDDVPGLVEDCISLVVRELADVRAERDTAQWKLAVAVALNAKLVEALMAVRDIDEGMDASRVYEKIETITQAALDAAGKAGGGK